MRRRRMGRRVDLDLHQELDEAVSLANSTSLSAGPPELLHCRILSNEISVYSHKRYVSLDHTPCNNEDRFRYAIVCPLFQTLQSIHLRCLVGTSCNWFNGLQSSVIWALGQDGRQKLENELAGLAALRHYSNCKFCFPWRLTGNSTRLPFATDGTLQTEQS
jgi:hypothetical protein